MKQAQKNFFINLLQVLIFSDIIVPVFRNIQYIIYENVLLDNVPNPGYDYAVGNDEKHIFQNNLIYSLTSSLVSQKLGDTTCYLWNNMGNKVWYNKDNLLVVKANFGTAEENGQKVDVSYQYEYSTGTVTDEQVALPDLTNYTVK